jgi:hypothetical protein
VEQIIPISLRVDGNSDYNDDESDQSELQHPDLELHQCKLNETYGFPSAQDQQGVRDQNININSSRPYPGSYGWYPQLPPTINIFACPPPPPPYCSNSGQPIFKPTVLPGFGRVQVPQHGFSISVPSSVAQFDDNRNSSSGVETPAMKENVQDCSIGQMPGCSIGQMPSCSIEQTLDCLIEKKNERLIEQESDYSFSFRHSRKVLLTVEGVGFLIRS